MESLLIRDTKNQIINFLNARDIPLEVKRLILADILTEVTALADSEIKECLNAKKENDENDEAEENE